MGLYLYAAGSPARYVDAQGMMAGLPFMPRFDTNLEKEAIGLYTDFTLAAKVPNILSIFGIEGIPLGAAGGGGASAMFFPSTCELAVFKQRGGAFAAWDDPDKEERFHREYSLGEDHEGGVGAGVDAGLQMATYMGQGEASADSYTGYFHTPSGGYLIGAGSAFVSDDGKWAGASFGGAWGTPTGAFMSWYYTLESSVDLDDKYKTKGRCACYCINFFAPDGPTHLAAIVNRNAREWGEGAAEARRSSGVTDTSGTGLPNRAAPPPIPPAGRSLPDPIPVPP